MNVTKGPGGGSGSFSPGPLLSGVAGNNNDTLAASPVAGDLVFGNATPLWARLAIGATALPLTVVGGLPAWAVLTVPGGGTGVTSLTAYAVICGGTTTTGPVQALAALGAAGTVLTSNGAAALPSFQAAASGGANTALSNLAAVAINTTLVSDTNITDDLGTASIAWRTLYVNKVVAGGSGQDFLTLSAAVNGDNIIQAKNSNGVGLYIGNNSNNFAFNSSAGQAAVALQAGGLLSVDASAGASSAQGDSGFIKTVDTGGIFSMKYDATETWRDDGTNFKTLASRRPGGYLALTDANPAWRVGGNHKIDTTAVASTATGAEETLITYALPAALITTNKDRIDFAFVFTFGATARTKQVKIYFGATVVFDTGAVIFNGGQATISASVIRTGAATQVAIGTFNGDVTLITQLAAYTTPAETLANSITIKATSTVGAGAAANDVINKFMVCDFFPGGG